MAINSSGVALIATSSSFKFMYSKFDSNNSTVDSAITAIKTSYSLPFLIWGCEFKNH
jgi:hypothetical protein